MLEKASKILKATGIDVEAEAAALSWGRKIYLSSVEGFVQIFQYQRYPEFTLGHQLLGGRGSQSLEEQLHLRVWCCCCSGTASNLDTVLYIRLTFNRPPYSQRWASLALCFQTWIKHTGRRKH
jgi:hypothetical protein